MNRDPQDHRLADYLGHEMEPAERARFEQELAADPALGAEVAALRNTLDVMHRLDIPNTAPVAPSTGGSWRAPPRLATVLRYAAAVALSFGLGYAVRDATPSHAPTPEPKPTAQVEGQPAPRPTREWETRFAQAYARNPKHSTLARSLTALAYATR